MKVYNCNVWLGLGCLASDYWLPATESHCFLPQHRLGLYSKQVADAVKHLHHISLQSKVTHKEFLTTVELQRVT